jgi:hypothetical protein
MMQAKVKVANARQTEHWVRSFAAVRAASPCAMPCDGVAFDASIGNLLASSLDRLRLAVRTA